MPYILILLVCLCGCSRNARAPGGSAVVPDSLQEFKGMYSSGFEEMSFQPCNSRERWWVADAGPLAKAYRDMGVGEYEPVFAIVRGDTSGLGKVGHLGAYQRYLRVREVVRIGRPTDKPIPPNRCE